MIKIIGAGPAGLSSAYLLAKAGKNIEVFDRKKQIGSPIQCTGILTHKAEEIIKIKPSVIQNKIHKIKVHSLNNSATLKLKKPDTILNRCAFDQSLADLATKEGVKINLENSFQGTNNKKLKIKNNNKITEHNYSHLIGADGPLSKVYNIINSRPRTFYKGIQATVKGNFAKDTFSVYLGSMCPKFFAWLVPENEEIARVGLSALDNQKVLFDKFLNNLNLKKIVEYQAGLIPIYDPKIQTQKNNIYLIGDAASQIKSTTGGGIIQSLIASKYLANAITKNTNYHKLWKKNMHYSLLAHLKLRKYLDKFTDKDYDKLVKMLKNKNLANVLETESRDNPIKLLSKAMFAKPSLLTFVKKLI